MTSAASSARAASASPGTSWATTRWASSIAAATTPSPPIPGRPFDNNYTLNTVDICPVGALTSKDFRFQMRVWFLKETKSLCTSCATGCNILIGSREEKIYRYTPRENDAVNGSWMCDAGRLNYKWIRRADRLTDVLVRRPEIQAWRAALSEIAGQAQAGAAGFGGHRRLGAPDERGAVPAQQACKAKLGALTDSIPRHGEGDKLLVNADKNPNTNGARLTGICFTEDGHQPAEDRRAASQRARSRR